jgi:hypothetical protein
MGVGWPRDFRQGPENALPFFGKRGWDDTQQGKLERKIGRQTLEIVFVLSSSIKALHHLHQTGRDKPDLASYRRTSA